jgi:DNA (cytosine-5)-methyltransferase 1
MKFLSLFSGIGGFDLAFQRAGMVSDSIVEIDKNCQNVLRRHFPDSKLFTDVKEVGNATHKRGSIDVICGGFPCQDLSIAGKRAGLVGERTGLWFEFARIIDELEPRWVVAENVPGLLSSNKGADFETIIRWLAERGYGVAWRVLDAQYFGVAQRRRRVFIVASLGSGRAAEVLFERKGMSGDTPQGRKERKGVAKTIAGGSNKCHSDITSGEQDANVICVLEQNTQATMPNLPSLREVFPNFGIFDRRGYEQYGEAEMVSTISARDYKSATDLVATSWTLRQGKEGGGKGYLGLENKAMTLGGQQQFIGVRRLTPTECERLQGFPDGWTDGQSDSVKYRQLGNAVAVPVVEWIGKRMALHKQ